MATPRATGGKQQPKSTTGSGPGVGGTGYISPQDWAAILYANGVPAPAPAAVPPPPPAPPPAPTVPPFMTGPDMMELANAIKDFNTSIADIDQNLATMSANNTFQQTQIDKTAAQDTSTTNDNMAARGLFRSSVRDAGLFDIEATQRLKKQFLDDQMHIAQVNADTKKLALQQGLADFQKGMQQKMVENAQGIQADMPAFMPNAQQTAPLPPLPNLVSTPSVAPINPASLTSAPSTAPSINPAAPAPTATSQTPSLAAAPSFTKPSTSPTTRNKLLSAAISLTGGA